MFGSLIRLRSGWRRARKQLSDALPTLKIQQSVYSPHSLCATTATLLLDAREPIESVQVLLSHKYITTTQIYEKCRRSMRDSASHKEPI